MTHRPLILGYEMCNYMYSHRYYHLKLNLAKLMWKTTSGEWLWTWLTFKGTLWLQITSNTLYALGKNLRIHGQVVHHPVQSHILKNNGYHLKSKILGYYNISPLESFFLKWLLNCVRKMKKSYSYYIFYFWTC